MAVRRKLKMNHRYKENYLKEKYLRNRDQRELYQNPPKALAYEGEAAFNREEVFKDIYAGIYLFDRLIYEAKRELKYGK